LRPGPKAMRAWSITARFEMSSSISTAGSVARGGPEVVARTQSNMAPPSNGNIRSTWLYQHPSTLGAWDPPTRGADGATHGIKAGGNQEAIPDSLPSPGRDPARTGPAAHLGLLGRASLATRLGQLSSEGEGEQADTACLSRVVTPVPS
jgi:hypothetical protein